MGQLLFPVVTQSELGSATELAATGEIAGVVIVGDVSVGVEGQIAELQAASIVGPSLVAVDEEGGRVQRVASLVGSIPSARSVASDLTSAEARELARAHAEKLGALGFTMNLAPVLDLDTGSYIRDRSFSPDPATVAEYGIAVAAGIEDAGLVPVAKHFPGHGRGIDSHTGLPVLPPLVELRATDLVPFELAAAMDVPIMIGHLVVPDLTGDEPASQSAAAIAGLLRDDLGFDGLVMTDAFNMDAITDRRNGAEAARQAIGAGVDLAMLGGIADVAPTIEMLTQAVAAEEIELVSVNRSFLRVLETKGITACDLPAEVAPGIRCDGVTDGGCGLVVG